MANPDALRTDDAAVDFVRAFLESGKPVAAICHAPWTLIETGLLTGRTLTSWPSLKTDLTNARATWADEEVVVDRQPHHEPQPGRHPCLQQRTPGSRQPRRLHRGCLRMTS